MYKPSAFVCDFSIAGTKYWDAALVLSSLKPGDNLSMVCEPDNPYDPNAIALYKGESKLGFVPRNCNALFAQLMCFGHNEVFECRILKVDPEEETYNQIQAGIYVKKMG